MQRQRIRRGLDKSLHQGIRRSPGHGLVGHSALVWQRGRVEGVCMRLSRRFLAGFTSIAALAVAGCGSSDTRGASVSAEPALSSPTTVVQTTVVQTTVISSNPSGSTASSQSPTTSATTAPATTPSQPWFGLTVAGASAGPVTVQPCCVALSDKEEHRVVWTVPGGPTHGLLLVTVRLGVGYPGIPLEGDYTSRLLSGVPDGEAWLSTPLDASAEHKPMDSFFEVKWDRSNGDVWHFQEYGMSAQQLIDLALQATPGSATAVQLPNGSATLLAAESRGASQSTDATYTIDGLTVGLSVRNDGGAFGLLILANDIIRPVTIAGVNGFEATLTNGQVEVVWDAGGGWWGELSIHPGLATRADEIIRSLETKAL